MNVDPAFRRLLALVKYYNECQQLFNGLVMKALDMNGDDLAGGEFVPVTNLHAFDVKFATARVRFTWETSNEDGQPSGKLLVLRESVSNDLSQSWHLVKAMKFNRYGDFSADIQSQYSEAMSLRAMDLYYVVINLVAQAISADTATAFPIATTVVKASSAG